MVGLPKRPYPGLRPFAIDEWETFFGREIMTEDVVQRLLRNGLVLVHGSSGSGKSSLVYAGVLPQLERRRRRRNLTIKTGMIRPGRSPLRSLAVELARLCASPTESPDVDAMHRILIQGRSARGEIEARIRAAGPNELCIFIDQFEELFRFAREGNPEEARIFAEVLVGLAGANEADAAPDANEVNSSPVGIFTILTMRSEFLGDCTAFPGLAETVNRTQYLLPNMARADLLRAIREPAALYGGSVDWDLAERLVHDATGEQDALPLIQHALMRLWEKSSSKSLQLADYMAATALPKDAESPPAGTGMAYILAAHAEEVMRSSLGQDRKDGAGVIEHLFRALTDIDNEGRAIRRPQRFDRLSEAFGATEDILKPILDAFRADGVSFVTPYESSSATALTSGNMIDISHEALIRCWPRIADRTIDPTTGRPRGWLHQEFQDGLVWRSLAVQAQMFLANPEACLDPATTEQRWPWFETIKKKPAWALRYLIESKRSPVPRDEPEWQAVEQLMTASYARWQAEKNRTRSAELKAEIARTEVVDPKSLRGVRQKVMQLFQDGRYGDAVTKLQAQIEAFPHGTSDWAELQGLLGRAYKEIFIESQRNPDAAFLDSEIALQHAIDSYRQAFEALGTVWPGLNLLALSVLAQEAGYANLAQVNPAALTRRLLEEMDRTPPSQRDNFYHATMMELRLAVGDWDTAEQHLHSFIEDTSTTASLLRSAIRQLTDVWRLEQKGDRGRGFVTAMQAALIAIPGARLDLFEDATRTLSEPQPHDEQLKKILGADGIVKYEWLQKALTTARAVCVISDGVRGRMGTGFLVGGGDFDLDVDEPLVMTTAHVFDDAPHGAGPSHRDARVTFQAVDEHRSYAVAELVWNSRKLDACLLRLDKPVLDILPLQLAKNLPSPGPSLHPRVYVIGHPGGRDLAFSIQDNELLDHEGPPSGTPPDPAVVRLHYRAPTEPGSAGSPVFESSAWRVIALHHAGGNLRRLNGQTGTHQANEGIWIQSIAQAVRQNTYRAKSV
jgi:hypothetical protein